MEKLQTYTPEVILYTLMQAYFLLEDSRKRAVEEIRKRETTSEFIEGGLTAAREVSGIIGARCFVLGTYLTTSVLYALLHYHWGATSGSFEISSFPLFTYFKPADNHSIFSLSVAVILPYHLSLLQNLNYFPLQLK